MFTEVWVPEGLSGCEALFRVIGQQAIQEIQACSAELWKLLHMNTIYWKWFILSMLCLRAGWALRRFSGSCFRKLLGRLKPVLERMSASHATSSILFC